MSKYSTTAVRIAFAAGGGVAGGLVMAILAMICAGVERVGFWLPIKSIAATYAGVDALIGGATAVGLGMLTHLLVSASVGLVFGLLVPPRLSRAKTGALAIVYCLFVWASMTFVVLPLVNTVMLDRVLLSPGWWFVLHLVFGFVLGIATGVGRASGVDSARAVRRSGACGVESAAPQALTSQRRAIRPTSHPTPKQMPRAR